MKKLFLIFAILALAVASATFAQSASADAPKKVVVRKYVTTPGGELDHIVIVSENALSRDGFNGSFPFTFSDKHVSVAVRYAKTGEQAKDISPSACATTPAKDTPTTPEDPTRALPDTGGSQQPLLLLALSMIGAGSVVLWRTSPRRQA